MRGLVMEIRKKDYTRVYDLILAELETDGHGEMVAYLEENPPKRTRGTLYSVDIVNALVAAKRVAGPQLGALDLANLDSVKNHGNLRQMLNHSQEDKWFKTLKAMGGKGKTGAKQIQLVWTKTDLETGTDDGPENEDECICDACNEEYPFWKNDNTLEQLCDACFKQEVNVSGGEHGFQPWDCEKDEYYEYREDIP